MHSEKGGGNALFVLETEVYIADIVLTTESNGPVYYPVLGGRIEGVLELEFSRLGAAHS
jgi:hypothetical protein